MDRSALRLSRSLDFSASFSFLSLSFFLLSLFCLTLLCLARFSSFAPALVFCLSPFFYTTPLPSLSRRTPAGPPHYSIMDPETTRSLARRLRGILPVIQTPFCPQAASPATGSAPDSELVVDLPALASVARAAAAAGAVGFLAPAVASETALLTSAERRDVLHTVASESRAASVPLVAGASSESLSDVLTHIAQAKDVGAAAVLVAVPTAVYAARPHHVASLLAFFQRVGEGCAAAGLPLLVQDLEFNGPGLAAGELAALAAALPQGVLFGVKVETAPAGPKYTAVRAALGADVLVAGGWAVQQMLEALDRGVDAMIPEASMVALYVAVDRLHRAGNRSAATALFYEIVPVLAFTNQTLAVSVAFFKRLLRRKGLIASESMRLSGFVWDAYNARIADELIELVLALEGRVAATEQ